MWKEQNQTAAAISRRRASIKETGEELSPEDWARFDAAIAEMRAERARASRHEASALRDRLQKANGGGHV